MRHYRINYIDACDGKYKSLETTASNPDDAVFNLHKLYDRVCNHHIVEVIEIEARNPMYSMRIGSITAGPSPAVTSTPAKEIPNEI